jgi:hypothetical protein
MKGVMMFEAFGRSWEMTKLSFRVITADIELILYPILAGIFSVLFMVSIAVPAFLPYMMSQAGLESISTPLMIIVAFLYYLGLAFITTFFNVCVVYTAKKRFEGGNAVFFETLQFAISKIHLIFMWSLLAATVGMILRILDHLAEKMGGIGRIIFNVLTSFIGLIWGIAIIFVVPAMVYKDMGPFEAIKESVRILKQTWGESLIRYYGLGLIQGMVIFVGLILSVGIGFVLFALFSLPGLILAIALFVIFVGVVAIVFSLANTIFNTALFVYADQGIVPAGYNANMLENAFKAK